LSAQAGFAGSGTSSCTRKAEIELATGTWDGRGPSYRDPLFTAGRRTGLRDALIAEVESDTRITAAA
jgi:hypothetical protein